MSNDQTFLQQQLPSIAGMAGAIAVRSVIKKTYASRKGTEPPIDPGAEGASLSQAVLWSAVLAAGAASGRLLSRYLMGEQMDKVVGDQRSLQQA